MNHRDKKKIRKKEKHVGLTVENKQEQCNDNINLIIYPSHPTNPSLSSSLKPPKIPPPQIL
jgi:hypothetical protein